MLELRSLATVSGSYLRNSISKLWIEAQVCRDSKYKPWLHLIPTTRKLLPRVIDTMDWLQITGPLGKELSTMRSIHMHLPRRPPSSFSNTIQDLELQKIHFRRLSDLAHTLSELCNLQHFIGEGLTWTDSEPALTPLHWRERSRSDTFLSPRVRLLNCTRNVEAVSLLTGVRYKCIHLCNTLESLACGDPRIGAHMMLEHPEGLPTITCV